MSNIKELLEYQIYPALYERIETALPEFQFIRIGNGYRSTTEIKITGEKGKKGKVYIYDNNITRLIDFTRGSISIWDYLQQRDRLNNNETLQLLSKLSGVALKEYTPEELEKIKQDNRISQLWEEVNNFLVLNFHLNTKPEADRIREYCKDRGYTLSDVRAPKKNKDGEVVLPEPDFTKDTYKMELGYLPSQRELREYLIKKGYTEKEIKNISLLPAIGETHSLTIPYRDPVGKIRGIAVRNIKHSDKDKTGKYLYSTGLERADILFNLKAVKGDKDLVIVEGLLDSLIATARGLENVVALGGSTLNSSQIKQALRYGAKKFTLCFDRDSAGAEATKKAIQTLLREGIDKIYIAELPYNKKGKADPDSHIKEKGIEDFKKIIKEARVYYKYLADSILEGLRGKTLVEDKYKDALEESIAQTYINIPSISDRYKFINYLNRDLEETGIYKEVIEQKVKEFSEIKTIEAQKRELNKILSETQSKVNAGDIKEAQRLLEAGVKSIRIESGKDLIQPYTFEDWRQEIESTPPSLKTGIKAIDEIVRIPLGAITLIAGRPSHGKTTLMFNMLLNMSRLYPGKKFYFFSYEEQRKFILLKILNSIINEDLHSYITDYPAITNLERLRYYVKDGRTDIEVVEKGKQKLKELLDSNRIEIIDKPYTVEELSSVVSYLHSKEELGAVFIDYIQRVRINTKTQDKRIEIATISDYILNNIAKETGLPVILGAQLNRETIKAGEKKPTLEGLKEAGNLEEDANLVLSVYNESKEKEKEGGWGRHIDLEIKTLKNRDGEANKKGTLKFDRYTGHIKER